MPPSLVQLATADRSGARASVGIKHSRHERLQCILYLHGLPTKSACGEPIHPFGIKNFVFADEQRDKGWRAYSPHCATKPSLTELVEQSHTQLLGEIRTSHLAQNQTSPLEDCFEGRISRAVSHTSSSSRQRHHLA